MKCKYALSAWQFYVWQSITGLKPKSVQKWMPLFKKNYEYNPFRSEMCYEIHGTILDGKCGAKLKVTTIDMVW